MMEIERLKSLKFQEEREKKRKEAQREGALVIVDQIKERELQRIQEREIMEQEKQMILKQIDDNASASAARESASEFAVFFSLISVGEKANSRTDDCENLE